MATFKAESSEQQPPQMIKESDIHDTSQVISKLGRLMIKSEKDNINETIKIVSTQQTMDPKIIEYWLN